MPQDWAPYTSLQDAATVYLRDPDLALEQMRSVVEFPGIAAFIMSRGESEEHWGTAVWQEVVATDGLRLILWRADDEFDDDRRQLTSSCAPSCSRRSATTS